MVVQMLMKKTYLCQDGCALSSLARLKRSFSSAFDRTDRRSWTSPVKQQPDKRMWSLHWGCSCAVFIYWLVGSLCSRDLCFATRVAASQDSTIRMDGAFKFNIDFFFLNCWRWDCWRYKMRILEIWKLPNYFQPIFLPCCREKTGNLPEQKSQHTS